MENVRISGLSNIHFGVLDGLAGTWTGDKGMNLIAVPNQQGSFELLVMPYNETLVIEKVEATTPNRGLNAIAQIPTLQYRTKIIHALNQSLLHVENGFWELLVDKDTNDGYDIFRIATVPHGDALLAMGTSSVKNGPPDIDTTLSALPIGAGSAYGDLPYHLKVTYPNRPPFYRPEPNQYLAECVKGLHIKETIELKVSTKNAGGISNIPSLSVNTPAPQVDATFWLITCVDNTKKLMYSQKILIEFPVIIPGSDGLVPVIWPHITVNILDLQP